MKQKSWGLLVTLLIVPWAAVIAADSAVAAFPVNIKVFDQVQFLTDRINGHIQEYGNPDSAHPPEFHIGALEGLIENSNRFAEQKGYNDKLVPAVRDAQALIELHNNPQLLNLHADSLHARISAYDPTIGPIQQQIYLDALQNNIGTVKSFSHLSTYDDILLPFVIRAEEIISIGVIGEEQVIPDEFTLILHEWNVEFHEDGTATFTKK